jgi:nitrogen regulatory protein PII
MRKIEAFIQPFKLDEVKEALSVWQNTDVACVQNNPPLPWAT